MIGHLHYIMSSKYELFFNLLSVALVIINHHTKNGHDLAHGTSSLRVRGVHNFPQTISINQTSPLARFLEK